jgi:type VI protein secretion system component Hcp
MRTAPMAAPVIASVLLLAANAAMAASADYYLTFKAVSRDATGGLIYLKAHSSGDLDGDGQSDDVVIRMECSAGVMHTAQYQVISPRDAASGQASGKRMHKPFTIVKEWGPATPQLMAMKTGYDVKKVEGTGARAISYDDSWNPISLSNSEALCATAAAAKVTKTRSNIQNN